MNDADARLRELESALSQISLSQERTSLLQDQTVRRLESLDRQLNGDGDSPGLFIRFDRMERSLGTAYKVVSFIGSGGLLGLITTVLILYEILQKLSAFRLPPP